jgi:hypothetical protein
MTHHDDELLATFLAEGPHHGRASALEETLARVRTLPQRAGWLVSATGGTIAQQPGGTVLRFAATVTVVIALLAVVIGALVVGLNPSPPPQPTPPLVESASPDASRAPSEPLGLVAYEVMAQLAFGQGDCLESRPAHWCQVRQIWISHTDGSDAHALHPDDYAGEELIGWAPDGSGILHLGQLGITLSSLSGETVWAFTQDQLCVGTCVGSDGPAISPDGTRLAYSVSTGDATISSVIAILDIASGHVTELESTRATIPVADISQCPFITTCEGANDGPEWSPDGTRLAFARQIISPEPGSPWTSAITFVVNADGSDLHRVSPEGFYAIDPHWSPDGSQLAFINAFMVVNAEHTTVLAERDDIYTVDPVGSNLRRLTNDGSSAGPEWTAAGRITFFRPIPGNSDGWLENWIMDANGTNARNLGFDLGQLTAAGCQSCLYPAPTVDSPSAADGAWQP